MQAEIGIPMNSPLFALRAALARGEPAAIQMIAKLINKGPKVGAQWLEIGREMLMNSQVDIGKRALSLFVRQSPDRQDALFRCAKLLANARLYTEASEYLDQIVGGAGAVASIDKLKGLVSIGLGDRDAAISHLLNSARSDPDDGQTWYLLSVAEAGRSEEALRLACSAKTNFRGRGDARQRFLYGLARLLENHGRADEAFDACLEAGAALSERVPYDVQADLASARRAVKGASAWKSLAHMQRRGNASQPAIIVTGLARSGTTLVQQILVSHSAVDGGDELGFFALFARDYDLVSVDDLLKWNSLGKDPSLIGNQYIGLARQRFATNMRFVDKSLEASRYLGLVVTLLAGAPVVWVRRNRLDCALSNLKAGLQHAESWSGNLASMGRHFAIEELLYRRWRDLLGDLVITVDYEAIVSTPKAEIPSLLARCGLDFEPATLRPDSTTRPVMTLSAMQVREPIASKRVGSAHPFAARLRPFSAAFEETLEIFSDVLS